MEIKYTRQGDYLIPNLTIKTNNVNNKINRFFKIAIYKDK